MRYTETALDKLIRIHHGMVDNIINQACVDLEAIKPKPVEKVEVAGLAAVLNQQDLLGQNLGLLRFGAVGLFNNQASQGRLGTGFSSLLG